MKQIYNPDEIISKANGMKEQSGELKNLIDQMSTIVDELSSAWQSPAQQKFVSKFDELQPQLMEFCTAINKFAERATKQAEAVKKVEVI